ncbi:BTAD domain-containing putative transcriptional regulator [Streptomonospora arabica]|uniref:BTAD domain-containing putative transcriptional regulator n=1 Tax=Streptomonospora arabica TaxID=412417 RepID=UPI003380FCF0
MRFCILGPLAVYSADGAALPIGGARLRRLLVLLLLTPGRTVGSERLVRGVWGDEPAPENSGNALQALASRLRRALGDTAPLRGDPAGYRLDVDPACVDLHRFDELARRGRAARAEGDPQGAEALLGEALALWRGPALSDLSGAGGADDVAVRLAESHRSVSLERLTLLLEIGRHDDALPDIEELAAREPHDERPVELLVRALSAAGRQADALAAYDRLRHALAGDLGIDPSPHMQRLQVRLLRGELNAGDSAPARAERPEPPPASREQSPPPAPRPVKRLPHTLTSFVAREDEVDQVGALLVGERLVTLIGPGGAGKTRLSIEAGSRFVEERPDSPAGGVWFVELAPLRDGADIPHALVSALGLYENSAVSLSGAPTGTGDLLDRVVDFVDERELLLILDNCEHLVAETAEAAEHLLARCARLRLLATSREPLGIAGERLLAVPSLALPPETTPAADAGDYASVRLFAERARAADPAFAVDAGNAEHVVRICRELDGMPLALELAAARLRAMPPAHLAARLSDRFRLLTNGNRFALPQHQTLQAVVDWSWELLDGAERTLLRRLSVFAGGASLEAVEHVCSHGLGDDRDVWSVLFALVDKSLVTAEVGEGGEGQPRYRMLETVRAYGAQRLAESGEEPAVRRAHADYTLALWARADPYLRRTEQLLWLAQLRVEHDNLTAALRWAIDVGDLSRALDLLLASCWYWQMGNAWSDLVRWCGELLRAAGEHPPEGRTVAYAHCLAIHSLGADFAGPETSTKGLLRAEQILVELGDPPENHPGLLLVLMLLGMLGYDREERIARLSATAADHPDPWMRTGAQLFGGLLCLHDGRGREGRDRVRTALERFRAIGDRWGTAHALTVAAGLYHLTDLDREMELLSEGDELAAEIGLKGLRAQFKIRQALCMAGRGRIESARRELAATRPLADESDTRMFCRMGEAEVDHAAGAPAAAYEKALSLTGEIAAMNPVVRGQVEPAWLALRSRTAMALGDRPAALADAAAAWQAIAPHTAGMPCADILEQLAEVLVAEWPERAAVALGRARSVRGLPNEAAPAIARVRAQARRRLGEAGFERAFASGADADPAAVTAWIDGWLGEGGGGRPAGTAPE